MTATPPFTQAGFPTGCLQGGGPMDALKFHSRHGFSSPEIHPSSVDDPVMIFASENFPAPSVHLPSYRTTGEEEALAIGHAAIGLGFQRLIVHPYVIRRPELWHSLGPALVLENLDFRFPEWRTAEGLRPAFEALPDARFCLDLAHTYGWVPEEADRLLEAYAHRLVAIHYSEIDKSNGDHLVSIGKAATLSHAGHLRRLGLRVPIVFEVAPNPEEDLLLIWQTFQNSL